MKRSHFLFLVFLFLPGFLYSENVDSLKRIAQKTNSAVNWNILAQYYYENTEDTFLLRQSAEQAFQLATAENNLTEIGNALIYFAELEYFSVNCDWNEYERKYKKALEYFRISNRVDLQANALNNLADSYVSTGRFDEAIKNFKESLYLNKDQTQTPIIYSNISRVFLKKGVEDSTIFYAERARNAAVLVKDTANICEINNQLGVLNKLNNRYKKALEYYQENLRLNNLSGNKQGLAIVCHNIAVLYMEWGKNDKALDFARKATDNAGKYKLENEVLGNTMSILGKALMLNKQYLFAIDTLKKSLSLIGSYPYSALYATLHLSSCYSKLNQLDSCEIYINKATEILSANKNLPEEECFLNKGLLLVQLGKYKEAVSFLTKSEESASKSGKSKVKNNFTLYNNLSIAYEKGIHNYQKALYYKKIAYNLQDSICKQENSEMIADFSVQYETAEKELEISRLNHQQQQMAFHRLLMVGGFVILAILLIILWLYNRVLRLRKEKEAALLSKRMEEKENEYQITINENERKQVQSYLNGLEAERNRIASELHDSLANEVLLVEMELEKSGQFSQNVFVKLKGLRSHVRSISHELALPIFHHISFPEILKNYVRVLNETSKFDIRLTMETQDMLVFLPEEVSGELYRIIQELVGNALKHSKGKQIKISLQIDNSQLGLSIEDDGIGFDEAKVSSGIGFTIIKRRCDNLNGNLQILSNKDIGTKIKLNIPYSIQP